MATWVLTKGLTTVRTEFNVVFYKRKKDSDGTIGDQSHSTGTSGHNPDRTGRAEYKDGDPLNEVRAIDLDKDLMAPYGITMEMVVQYLITLARSGVYLPFRYIIYRGRIWRKTDGWKTRTYTGANAHNEHAHFSGDYSQKADNWTGSLGLAAFVASKKPKPVPVPPKEVMVAVLDNADRTFISGSSSVGLCTLVAWGSGGGSHALVGDAVLNTSYPRRSGDSRTPLWTNIQGLQTDIDSLATDLAAVTGSQTALASQVGMLTMDIGDPGWVANDDPIVARVRYAIANP
jgi:hypothetical protein